MPPTPRSEVTQLLLECNARGASAADASRRLFELVYEELRRLAAALMRHERGDHTLQPTALVHEAFMKLVGPTHIEWKGKPYPENVGTMLLRNLYHYWYHLGEAQSIRQMLGHRELPQFVGYIPDDYYYGAEETE